MSINYNAIIGHKAKVTMPSVTSGLGSMYIRKDPPKSIHTRRINKVGETSNITAMIDDSGDRVCEAIATFARGVNPMVSVSYGNHGNAAMAGNPTAMSGKSFASMPYRIMNGGAFRPPVYDQRELLPLSRLPRTTTSSYTKPGFADYSKKLMCPQSCEKTAGVKNEMLQGCLRPTATYNLSTGVIEPFEVKYVIQNPVKVSAKSGIRTMDGTTTQVQIPKTKIQQNPTHARAQANKGRIKHIHDNFANLETDRYIQDTLHSDIKTNSSQNIQILSYEDIIDFPAPVKEINNISYDTVKTKHEKNDYIHHNPELQRKAPQSHARTNTQRNIYVRPVEVNQKEYRRNTPLTSMIFDTNTYGNRPTNAIMNTEYELKPTLTLGGMAGKGTRPTERLDLTKGHESEKDIMRRRIFDMQMNRTMVQPAFN